MIVSWMGDEIIKFVDARFRQYRMKFFKMNKRYFIYSDVYSNVIFDILENDEKINEKDFMELMQLQDDHGETIMFMVCELNENRDKFTELL